MSEPRTFDVRKDFEDAFKNWIHDKTYSLAYWSTEDIARYWATWAFRRAAKDEYCIFRDEDDIRKTITDDSLNGLADRLEPKP